MTNVFSLSRSSALIAVLLPLAAATHGAEPAGAVVEVDGVPALRVPLEAQGGMLIPEPAAVFNSGEGTVAVETKIDEFPSNSVVVDVGSGTANHITMAESYGGKSSAQGYIKFTVLDAHGASRTLKSPLLDAGQSYLLAFSHREKSFTFWINGKAIGTIEGTLNAPPDRLAVIDPIGLRWTRVAVWSEERSETQLGKLAEPRWPLDAKTTFLAVREGQDTTPQTGLIGSGLMAPADVLQAMEKPWARRELQVDAVQGRDDGDGSAATPFKTIGQAAAVAGPGDTVLIMPGIYRETLTLTRSGRPGAPITFRASPKGPVTMEGADPAEDFQSAGAVPGASLWNKPGFHSRDVPYGDDHLRMLLSKQRPAALKQLERRGRLDMVWCDDSLLPKADSRETLRPFSFWVDRAKDELLVALPPQDRPENHSIEIGARGPLIAGANSYIHLQGLHLRHDDSPLFHGSIDLNPASSHWLIENVNESGASWCGVRLGGWGHVLRHNVWDYNGDDGLDGSLLQYLLVDGDACRFNNWQRGINPDWGSGGVKLTQADHVTFRNCEIAFNLGIGIWFDCNNTNVLLEGCRSHHNLSGMFIEISPGPFVFRNNICFGNDSSGISVGESRNGLIENNTVVGNKSGISLRNIPGRDERYGGAQFGLTRPGESWHASDITIRRNIIAQNTVAGITNIGGPLEAGKDRISSESNLFFDNAAVAAWLVGNSAGKMKMDESNDWAPPAEGKGQTRFFSLDSVRKHLGLEQDSIVADPKFGFPSTDEWDSDPRGPAASLRAGPDFGMKDDTP